MRVLGIETSCDETGIALYDDARGLLAQALHSQIAMHERYGGVVPELASRDHVRRVLPRLAVLRPNSGPAALASAPTPTPTPAMGQLPQSSTSAAPGVAP